MENQIIVALIAAGASLIIAVWSLLTARLSRSLALAAEEHAKRGELVRVKALEAVQKFLDAVTELIVTISSLNMVANYQGGISWDSPVVIEKLETLAKNYSIIVRLRISATLYLPSNIMSDIDAALKLLEPQLKRINIKNLAGIEKELRSFAQSVSDYSRDRYLS